MTELTKFEGSFGKFCESYLFYSQESFYYFDGELEDYLILDSDNLKYLLKLWVFDVLYYKETRGEEYI